MTQTCDDLRTDAHADGPDQARLARERVALDRLLQRLATLWPHLSRGELARVVDEEYARFAGSRVREFVPILVERGVRARFRRAAAQL